MHDNEPIIGGDSGISYSKTSVNKKPFIIGGALLLVGALVAVFFVFIFPKLKSSEPEEPEVKEVVVDPEDVVEYQTADDYLSELERQAAEAATDSQRLEARLNIVSFLVSLERFDEAEAKMTEISTDGFATNDFYRYYNVYSRVYDNGRNPEKYEEYRSLTIQYLNKLQDENFDQIMDAAQESSQE